MRWTAPVSLAAVLLLAGGLAGCSGSSGGSRSSTSTSAGPSAAGPAKIDSHFFGTHDSDPTGALWPRVPVGSLRVWDAGTAWNQVETSPGVFDFTRLDAIVNAARAHKTEVLIVLGQTPAFHATSPSPDAAYGAGASSMPTLDAWRKYVDAVVRRYYGPDVQFQVWNEANVVNYWSGTSAQMAQLTAVARQVVDKVDPDITLVAPAFVTRLAVQRRWMADFFAQKVGGKPVGDLIDVVSLQLYPLAATPTPEAAMAELATDRTILATDNVDKPVWNTESNYGAKGGKEVAPASADQQVANVAETYLLSAANGVRRVFWYAWDLTQPIVDTFMVAADRVTPTAAGLAFGTVQSWMIGTTVVGCPVDTSGTYTCRLTAGGKTRLVLWNPKGPAQVKVPAGMTTAQLLTGSPQAVTAGGSLAVNAMPMLLTAGAS